MRAAHATPMASDLALRRTLTVRAADGTKLVLRKKRGESIEHVATKAVLWALYRERYPELAVEVTIGDVYKPDLVMRAPPPGGLAYGEARPVFWAEAGKVSETKWRSLFRRFPETHFVSAKWTRLGPHAALLRRALGDRPRTAPVELLGVGDPTRFLAADSTISIPDGAVERIVIAP